MQSNANEFIWWLGASKSSSTASNIVLKSLSAASVQLQSKGILEAVDELFEALNYQIFSIALLYIFQLIFLPSLMQSILVGSKLCMNPSMEWLKQLTSESSLFRNTRNHSIYLPTNFGINIPTKTIISRGPPCGFQVDLDVVGIRVKLYELKKSYDTVQAKGTFATHPFSWHISPYWHWFFFGSNLLPPLLQDTTPL